MSLFGEEFYSLLKELYQHAKKEFGITKPIKIFLSRDKTNSSQILGKTAHYDPSNSSITLFIDSRHPKDILRSFCHEMVHSAQDCRGEFDNVGPVGEGYTQSNKHLRKLEEEAYLKGCMLFRDWEDNKKKQSKI